VYKKKHLFLVTILVLTLTTIGLRLVDYVKAQQHDYYADVQQNQILFGQIYEKILLRYAEEIDPEKFVRAGINGMLGELDPYTVFIEQEDNTELQILLKNKYGGLGMRIIKREGFPTIIEPPINDTPAERAGIQEGDQIIEINGKSTKKLTVSGAAKQLRGEPGTKVSITIKRAGEPEPIEFHLIRAIIAVKDITYKNMLQNDVGYIQLSHFSKDAGNEVLQAIGELKLKGMKSLILDLRGNPGGLLEAAVTVTDNFLEKDELIVSTKGRIKSSNNSYTSKKAPTWDGPLVILVDGNSASASEIASGAIQDLDRGVIIGSPTFGKGLVQTVIKLPGIRKKVDLKLTTAKYYIPSGRLIQKQDFFNKGTNNVLLASNSPTLDSVSTDSSKKKNKKLKKFKTRNGRVIYEGGGITPDIVIDAGKLNRYQIALERKSMIFGFAVIYYAKHPELGSDFEITNEMLDNFREYLKEKKFTYKSAGLTYLENFEKSIKNIENRQAVVEHLEAIKNILEETKKDDFDKNKSYIKRRLKSEIAAKIDGYKGKIEATFKTDPVFLKALDVLSTPEKYSTILKDSSIYQGE